MSEPTALSAKEFAEYLTMAEERIREGDIRDLAWALAVRDHACGVYVAAHPRIRDERAIDDQAVCEWLKGGESAIRDQQRAWLKQQTGSLEEPNDSHR